MKKIYTLFVALIIMGCLMAQAPDRFNYQAVVRGSGGSLIVNSQVGIKISILQGSTSGSAVCIEEFSPTTNDYGLVTLEIGSVNSVDFEAIDWSAGPYFVKIELDENGGTSYSEMGTSQLLSVPYALHAKTANTADYNNLTNLPALNITNWNTAYGWGNHASAGYLSSELWTQTGSNIHYNTGNVGIGTTSPTLLFDVRGPIRNTQGTNYDVWIQGGASTAYGDYRNLAILGFMETNGDRLHINYNGEYEGGTILGANVGIGTSTPAYKLDVAGNINFTGNLYKNGSPYSTTYQIGDFAQGGIVFWLDETGQHGLIAATTDQSTGIQWYNGTFRYTGAKGDGMYAGEMNTAMIVATQIADNQTGNFAARVCADYSVTVGGVTYGDWYLPSLYELNLMYLQRETIGGFSHHGYWSSTGEGSGGAWLQFFPSGNQTTDGSMIPRPVRAVRAF